MRTISRRVLPSLLVIAFLWVGLPAYAQSYDLSPADLYKPPGDSCTWVWIEPYPFPAPAYLEIDGGAAYFAEGQNCIDEYWSEGWHNITAIVYDLGGYYDWYPAYGGFNVYPAPPPSPVIYTASSAGDNWDWLYVTGTLFEANSQVVVYSFDWGYAQTYSGLNVSPDGQSLSFYLQDATLRNWFGWDGIRIKVVNSNGTESAWRVVQAPQPTISSAGPTCSDLYCIQFNGSFPLSAYVDFRIPGQPQIYWDYTDLQVTSTQITLRLNPSLRSIYDTTGLDAWVVNPSLGNWSSGYNLPPLDRSVTGYIDDVYPAGLQYHIRGWACTKTQPGSIDVHVYVGGPAGGGGTFVFSGTANLASEPAVASACNSSGSNYRYDLAIPHTVTQYYPGQPFYVYGISSLGYGNLPLNNSGYFYVPAVDRSVTGIIEGISQQGQDYYLYGWACAKTNPGSIDVHVYVGGAYGSGSFAFSGTANLASDGGIAAACNSNGANYRFSLQIPQSVRDQYPNQLIYVHGISPFGLGNLLLNNSGTFAVPVVDRSITGWIEGISQQSSSFYLQGWACAKTYPGSINVEVYVGGAAGSGGTLAFSGTANQPSDAGIATACNSTGSNYRFWLQIPQGVMAQYSGQRIWVHGISPFGLPNLAIGNSGNLTVPGAPVISLKEFIYLGDRVIAVETTNQ